MNLQGIILLLAFAVLLIATYGLAGPIGTQSEVNKIKTLDVDLTSTEALINMTLTGTGSTIEDVTLEFNNNLPTDTNVSISLKDSSGVEIGSGSKTLDSPSTTVTINLTDTVTEAERPNLREADITVV